MSFIAGHRAEEGVGETGDFCTIQNGFGQADGFIDGSGVGHPVHEKDLISTEPEELEKSGFYFFLGKFSRVFQGRIEASPPAESPEYEFPDEGPVEGTQVWIPGEGFIEEDVCE